MKPELFVSDNAPTETEFNPVENRDDFVLKPYGGLWTSPYHKTNGSGWIQWCLSNEFRVSEDGFNCHLLMPSEKATIYKIDSVEDLKSLVERFPKKTETYIPTMFRNAIDYKKASQEFDGIYLTERGQISTHLTSDYTLYGWDCECTLWMNWVFDRVESIGKRKFKYES